jgi:hypothetical protein
MSLLWPPLLAHDFAMSWYLLHARFLVILAHFLIVLDRFLARIFTHILIPLAHILAFSYSYYFSGSLVNPDVNSGWILWQLYNQILLFDLLMTKSRYQRFLYTPSAAASDAHGYYYRPASLADPESNESRVIATSRHCQFVVRRLCSAFIIYFYHYIQPTSDKFWHLCHIMIYT